MKKNRETYLKYIAYLSWGYSSWFGNIWWYGLIHEKNVTKSYAFHRWMKGLPPEKCSGVFLGGVRKVFGCLLKCFTQFKVSKRSKIDCKTLVFCHNPEFLGGICNIPDSKVMLMVPSNSVMNVFCFAHVLDVVVIMFKWLWFFVSYSNFKISILSYLEKEFHRSFRGDVLVEGLFYEKIFRRIRKEFKNVTRVVYVYEGHAWEKAMLLAFNDSARTVGVQCSAPSLNILNYHYHSDEVEIMPAPDVLCVIGKIPKKIMMESYGDRVHLLGTTRYQHLMEDFDKWDIHSFRYLLCLSHDLQISRELIRWCEGLSSVLVRCHPDLDIPVSEFPIGKNFAKCVPKNFRDLRACFSIAQEVIAHDTTLILEAMWLGKKFVIPKLPSFVELDPLYGVFDGTTDREEFLRDYLTFRSESEMIRMVVAI